VLLDRRTARLEQPPGQNPLKAVAAAAPALTWRAILGSMATWWSDGPAAGVDRLAAVLQSAAQGDSGGADGTLDGRSCRRASEQCERLWLPELGEAAWQAQGAWPQPWAAWP